MDDHFMHLHPHPSMQWVTGVGLISQKGARQHVTQASAVPWALRAGQNEAPRLAEGSRAGSKWNLCWGLVQKMHLFALSRIPLFDLN